MRINARLDEATEQQLDYLTQVTGQSKSHVVRESVAQYYLQVRRGRPPSRFLSMAGQWRSGHADTASNVKAVRAEAMAVKFPPAPGKPARHTGP